MVEKRAVLLVCSMGDEMADKMVGMTVSQEVAVTVVKRAASLVE